MSETGAFFRDAHKMRGEVMMAQVGDRIRMINAPWMKCGDMATVVAVWPDLEGQLLLWVQPDRDKLQRGWIMAGIDQWQNLSR